VALFRYGVIADLVHLPPKSRGLYKQLDEKAAREYDIPGTLKRHVAAETIRGWLRSYRVAGFDALIPRQRADHGCSRAIPPLVVDRLCQLKEDAPLLTVPALILLARKEHPDEVSEDIVLAESTVHRLLARRGLMRKSTGEPTSKDHRKFEYAQACELWMSDVMYGPKLRVDGRLRQTYLIAFIDDATRVVPYAEFTLSEGAIAFLQVFVQALQRRGIPVRLYVDNGSAFRSRQLALVCAKLGIALIHARPYTPQGKGKMERWFRTVRMQLLPRLSSESTLSLDVMNRALRAWAEGEYHHAPHRGLHDETPADKWARTSESVRMPDANLGELFLAEQCRRVRKDRTVTLDGVAFEVDAALVNEQVVLRYDPARTPQKRSVDVWHQSKHVGVAKRVDMLANCHVKRNNVTRQLKVPRTDPDNLPEGLSMRTLIDRDGNDDEGAL
jgi:transposase InsO family protein